MNQEDKFLARLRTLPEGKLHRILIYRKDGEIRYWIIESELGKVEGEETKLFEVEAAKAK